MIGHSAAAGTADGFMGTRVGRALATNWAACFLVLMFVVFSSVSPNFLSLANFQNVLHIQTLPLLLAAAETFVIITGGIDLSVGFVTGLASVAAAKIIQLRLAAGGDPASSVAIACAAVLALSLLPGLVNGIMITKFKVPPFIATLGMWGITNGLALKISTGYPMMGLPDKLPEIGNGYFFYVLPGQFVSLFSRPAGFPYSRVRELLRILPFSLPLIVVVLAVLAFLLKRSRFGRHNYAIGGNVDAAIRSGISVDRHLIAVYMLSSLLAGLGGLFNIFQTGIGNYTTFNAQYEFFAVAAVVIGGASLAGGKGRIWSSAIGVLVLAFLENGLAISGVQPFYRYIAVGVLLVVAVVIDKLFPDLR
jgi:ribose/xylose/arabinose/galactoside ABC-type transport system permease subunit